MLTKRIIPCLDVRNGRVVKGVHFKDHRDVGDPVELAAWYNGQGADELVFYDITASSDGRSIMREVMERTAERVFIPLAVAGGLKEMLQMIRTSITGGRKVKFGGGASCEKKENLVFLSELMEKGDLKPVMEKSFAFDELVEAHRYTESGVRRGNVAVTVP